MITLQKRFVNVIIKSRNYYCFFTSSNHIPQLDSNCTLDKHNCMNNLKEKRERETGEVVLYNTMSTLHELSRI